MVEDHEEIYRRVPCHRPNFNPFLMVEGRVRFGSQAFGDPVMKPSVDLARLTEGPEITQRDPSAGVVTLVVQEVRAIATVVDRFNGNIVLVPTVREDPVEATNERPANPAHALIVCTPDITHKKVFYLLQEALALLATKAGWTLAPQAPEP